MYARQGFDVNGLQPCALLRTGFNTGSSGYSDSIQSSLKMSPKLHLVRGRNSEYSSFDFSPRSYSREDCSLRLSSLRPPPLPTSFYADRYRTSSPKKYDAHLYPSPPLSPSLLRKSVPELAWSGGHNVIPVISSNTVIKSSCKRTEYSDYLRPLLQNRPVLTDGYKPRSRTEREKMSIPIVRERKLIKFREIGNDIMRNVKRKLSWVLPDNIGSSSLIGDFEKSIGFSEVERCKQNREDGPMSCQENNSESRGRSSQCSDISISKDKRISPKSHDVTSESIQSNYHQMSSSMSHSEHKESSSNIETLVRTDKCEQNKRPDGKRNSIHSNQLVVSSSKAHEQKSVEHRVALENHSKNIKETTKTVRRRFRQETFADATSNNNFMQETESTILGRNKRIRSRSRAAFQEHQIVKPNICTNLNFKKENCSTKISDQSERDSIVKSSSFSHDSQASEKLNGNEFPQDNKMPRPTVQEVSTLKKTAVPALKLSPPKRRSGQKMAKEQFQSSNETNIESLRKVGEKRNIKTKDEQKNQKVALKQQKNVCIENKLSQSARVVSEPVFEKKIPCEKSALQTDKINRSHTDNVSQIPMKGIESKKREIFSSDKVKESPSFPSDSLKCLGADGTKINSPLQENEAKKVILKKKESCFETSNQNSTSHEKNLKKYSSALTNGIMSPITTGNVTISSKGNIFPESSYNEHSVISKQEDPNSDALLEKPCPKNKMDDKIKIKYENMNMEIKKEAIENEYVAHKKKPITLENNEMASATQDLHHGFEEQASVQIIVKNCSSENENVKVVGKKSEISKQQNTDIKNKYFPNKKKKEKSDEFSNDISGKETVNCDVVKLANDFREKHDNLKLPRDHEKKTQREVIEPTQFLKMGQKENKGNEFILKTNINTNTESSVQYGNIESNLATENNSKERHTCSSRESISQQIKCCTKDKELICNLQPEGICPLQNNTSDFNEVPCGKLSEIRNLEQVADKLTKKIIETTIPCPVLCKISQTDTNVTNRRKKSCENETTTMDLENDRINDTKNVVPISRKENGNGNSCAPSNVNSSNENSSTGREERLDQKTPRKRSVVTNSSTSTRLSSEISSLTEYRLGKLQQTLKFRKYNMNDFQFLKLLGKGNFGKVLLAELKGHEMFFALKCLKKDVVLEDDDVESTMIERRVLALGTQHPYMCKLYATFQTETHLCFVMEYLNGGDLMFHIRESGRFDQNRATFYGAEVACALKFLHKKGIVYRDIKLDNVVLDEDGHVRLVDFGMCQCRIYREEHLPSNFCGTPQYIAPEIVTGQKYNQAVDWWSFGVLLYEMLIGRSPFNGTDENELFWCICNEEPFLPIFLTKEARNILELLLTKIPAERLGMPTCAAGEIAQHAFFRIIDWQKLEKKQIRPPFKPHVKFASDTSNFDSSFTMDIATLTPVESAILKSMDQDQFKGFSYTNPHITG